MSQCSQPWVWEMKATEFWVPPTTKPASSRASISGSTLASSDDHVFDIAADREAHVTVRVFVGDIAKLSQREYIENALGAGTHRPNLVTAVRHVT